MSMTIQHNRFILTALVMLLAALAHAQVATQMARESMKQAEDIRAAKAAREARRAMMVDTATTYYRLVDSSQVFINRQQWPEAEQCLRRAIAAEPENPSNSLLLSNLATLQRYQGRYTDALKNYTLALDLTPNAVTLLLNRAAVYVLTGQTELARADYNRVATIDPNDIESRYSLGMLDVESLNFDQAEQWFKQVARIKPTSGLADEGLATLYKTRGDYAKAIEHLSVVIKSEPNPRLLANRADCHLMLHQLNLAADDIRQALEIDPEDPYLYLLRAKLNKLRFNRADTERDINLAVSHGLDRELIDKMLQ